MACPNGHEAYESLLASFNAQGKHTGVRPVKAALGGATIITKLKK